MTNPITTEQKTEEPTPTPTIQQQTESSRRRDREGRKDKKDKKKKDKKRDKNKKKERVVDEETQVRKGTNMIYSEECSMVQCSLDVCVLLKTCFG